MNAISNKSVAMKRKISLFLVLVCVFMGAANFSSWKANVISPGNIQQSAIGLGINSALAPTKSNQPVNRLTLQSGELVSRISLSAPGQFTLNLPVASEGVIRGNIDDAKKTPDGWELRGWTFIAEGTDTPEFVIALENEKFIGALKVSENRPDVAKALGAENALRTGYSGKITTPPDPGGCKLKLFTLSSALKLYAMPNACNKAAESSQ